MVATTMGHDAEGNWGIPVGTEVYAVDGEHLGSVVGGDAYDLVVEQGWFFVHDYQVPLATIDQFEDGKLFLSVSREQLIDPGGAP